MSFIIRILQVVVYLAIILAGYSFWFHQTLSDNATLTQFLETAKGYEVGAVLVRQQITANLPPNLREQSEVKSALDSKVTSEQVKKALQPAQIGIIDWIHTDSSVQHLHLQLDLQPLKDKILVSISDSQVGFQLKKTIPDVIQINPDDPTMNEFFQAIDRLKVADWIAVKALGWALLALGVSIGLIIVVRIRQGSKVVTSWAWPVTLAGITILLFAVVMYIMDSLHIIPVLDVNNLNTTLPYYIVRAIGHISFMPSLVLITLSAVVIVLAKLALRAKDKKRKRKHK